MEFSVIIPTRNRPALLKTAIASVMEQTFDDFEIIVINDGSDTRYQQDYQALESEWGTKVITLNLEQSWRGHGPSFARNMGALKAKGNYLCFLDDDDEWTDSEHLNLAHAALKQSGADAYFSNQRVYKNNSPTQQKLWLSPLVNTLDTSTKSPINGAYPVSIDELLTANGFCHLNTTIVCQQLFQQVNGFDETLRYEEDRAFYYQIIDNAALILYSPRETAKHNLPDIKLADSASTASPATEKWLVQLFLLNKSILTIKNTAIQRALMQHKAYTLKYISETLHHSGNNNLAYYYAQEALLIGFNLKWLAFTGWLLIKRTHNHS